RDGLVLDGARALGRAHGRDVAKARSVGQGGAAGAESPLVRRVVPVARGAARARGGGGGGGSGPRRGGRPAAAAAAVETDRAAAAPSGSASPTRPARRPG